MKEEKKGGVNTLWLVSSNNLICKYKTLLFAMGVNSSVPYCKPWIDGSNNKARGYWQLNAANEIVEQWFPTLGPQMFLD